MKQNMWKRFTEKKSRGKGFTLVELIVVLVILAILAALLLPTLTKYIDRASSMRVESACRMAVMGVKAETSMMYGKAPGGNDLTYYTKDKSEADIVKIWTPAIKNIENLAEVDTDTSYVQAYFTPKAEVKQVILRTAKYTCTYKDGGFTVEKVDYDMAKKGVALYYDGETDPILGLGDGEGST